MKKLFLSLLCCLSFAYASAAQYYVSGNGVAGNPWCNGLNWGATACAMTMSGSTGSLTFADVPAGSYQFKVTNGSSWYGISKFSESCSNLYAFGSDNICFSTQATQDITVSYDGSSICLTGSVGNQYPDSSLYAAVGVPSEYEGVMLQAFYWDSYKTSSKYATTKWNYLGSVAQEIAQTFDLIWLPPSGNGGGVGYYTKTYSNQDSDWGTLNTLRSFINQIHSHGSRVVADIVINHRQSSSGWCKSFTKESFGGYGTFQITSEHICSGDEAFTSSSSDSKTLPHGAADTGDNDGGCRDLDHTSEYVQQYVEAYLHWMLDSIRYDGFRYDMVKGYLGSYLSQYNLAADPYFSVAEYWDGTPSNLKAYLTTASYNTTVFDFSLKYKLNSSIGKGNFTGLKNAGLRSLGLSRYAVNFIDNHDTFERSDNKSDEFIAYNTNISTQKDRILCANAYILMLPGTPCVFWPHWYTFKDDIRKMIALRKAAGIHSESVVSDETATTSLYSATVQGHRGSVILRMGTTRDTSVPAGYFLAIHSEKFDIYASDDVSFTPVTITSLETLEAPAATAEKTIEDGRVVILKDGVRYDVLGRRL